MSHPIDPNAHLPKKKPPIVLVALAIVVSSGVCVCCALVDFALPAFFDLMSYTKAVEAEEILPVVSQNIRLEMERTCALPQALPATLDALTLSSKMPPNLAAARAWRPYFPRSEEPMYFSYSGTPVRPNTYEIQAQSIFLDTDHDIERIHTITHELTLQSQGDSCTVHVSSPAYDHGFD